jgi:hypothetical protein
VHLFAGPVFVSLEQGGLTIPAFTNLAHEVVAHNEFTGGDIIDNGSALQISKHFPFGAVTTLTHAVIAFIAAVDAGSHFVNAKWRSGGRRSAPRAAWPEKTQGPHRDLSAAYRHRRTDP